MKHMDESVAPEIKRWVEEEIDWGTVDQEEFEYAQGYRISIVSGVNPDSSTEEQAWTYSSKRYGPRLASILAARRLGKLEAAYPLVWVSVDGVWQAVYPTSK
jgi:hypothetical protein